MTSRTPALTHHNSCQMKTKHGCLTIANRLAKCHQLETLEQQIIYQQSTCVLWIMASKIVTMCSSKQKKRNEITTAQKVDRDSRYSKSLWAGHYGNWIPVGRRFSAPVQTSCEACLASHAMGTGFIPGVKKPGCGLSSAFMASSRVNFRVQEILIIEKIVRSVYHYEL